MTPAAARLPDPYRDEIALVQALSQSLRDTLDWPAVVAMAKPWVQGVRDNPAPFWAMESLLREYPISSAEGLSLMRLAEALLRVPDAETAIALTADQLGRADFDADSDGADGGQRLLANLSSSAIALSKKFLPEASQPPGVLQRLGAKTVVAATIRALQLLGRQFVLGRNIAEAMQEADAARGARPRLMHGAQPLLSYSYDMLGEGARTEDDARRYLASYQHAIQTIAGKRVAASPYTADGISIKLSALFSRYADAQRERVMAELLPRVQGLVDQAARANLNLTVDAEESDRLELSLDVFEALADHVQRHHPSWAGFGLAVQAYQTRALDVVDAVATIARQRKLRFMVRLVKGAYWDGEIKRAQEEGLSGYPVFTHKQHTDIAYLACAQRLFEHDDVIYPQLATHNAASVAAVLQMAARRASAHDSSQGSAQDPTAAKSSPRFELQRLHGMGEGIYREVLQVSSVACRVYAPVGEHRELLAYLVRRLLENGANSSFVHQLADEDVSPEVLLASPLHPQTAPGQMAPVHILGPTRRNSMGVDLTCIARRAPLLHALAQTKLAAVVETPVVNVDATMQRLAQGFVAWSQRPVGERAALLQQAGDALEARLPEFCGLIVHEGHRVLTDAVSEVREAVDFCRYYAVQAQATLSAATPGLGVVVCISPWNFPLAIFAGQVVAALVAGNAVAAKPAEQTPAVALRFIELLHAVGIPNDAVQWLHGPGETVGAALVAHPSTAGVCFTGSTPVARLIQRTLAQHADAPLPLIAETGGLNAMIVDSTALPEQVVDAVVQSAFRSAGQRCSALRLLLVHEAVADGVIKMLQGAMQELRLGDAAPLSTDVGPVIDTEAHAMLSAHIERLTRSAKLLGRAPMPEGGDTPNLIAPVAFELTQVSDLREEVFGPVLHVVRWRGDVAAVVQAINHLGYGLTLGVQTRIDTRALRIAELAQVGNVYVNRNIVGAVVGVQPFGGEGLSGTGPKAGGPHYLLRLVRTVLTGVASTAPASTPMLVPTDLSQTVQTTVAQAAQRTGASRWTQASLDERCAWLDRCKAQGLSAASLRQQLSDQVLPGPTGESNTLRLRPRGVWGAVAHQVDAHTLNQWLGLLACGNALLVAVPQPQRVLAQAAMTAWQAAGLPADALHVVEAPWPEAAQAVVACEAVHGIVTDPAHAATLNRWLCERPGAIVPLVAEPAQARLWRFCAEQTLTINTAAAGGNAELLASVKT
jgi:RHH-type transcriptional regulator, proline utilization regulon repressor / proline dehydrogenase / delta 1-pyrroline-5-carboxylate dehydrogenase